MKLEGENSLSSLAYICNEIDKDQKTSAEKYGTLLFYVIRRLVHAVHKNIINQEEDNFDTIKKLIKIITERIIICSDEFRNVKVNSNK